MTTEADMMTLEKELKSSYAFMGEALADVAVSAISIAQNAMREEMLRRQQGVNQTGLSAKADLDAEQRKLKIANGEMCPSCGFDLPANCICPEDEDQHDENKDTTKKSDQSQTSRWTPEMSAKPWEHPIGTHLVVSPVVPVIADRVNEAVPDQTTNEQSEHHFATRTLRIPNPKEAHELKVQIELQLEKMGLNKKMRQGMVEVHEEEKTLTVKLPRERSLAKIIENLLDSLGFGFQETPRNNKTGMRPMPKGKQQHMNHEMREAQQKAIANNGRSRMGMSRAA